METKEKEFDDYFKDFENNKEEEKMMVCLIHLHMLQRNSDKSISVRTHKKDGIISSIDVTVHDSYIPDYIVFNASDDASTINRKLFVLINKSNTQ